MIQVKVNRFLRVSILLAAFVIICSTAYSQRALQLTNLSSGKKLFIKEGQRIVYVLKGSTSRSKGILEKVNESSVTIAGYDFKLEELKSIGRKRKGSGFWSTSSAILGVGMIIGSIQSANSDPCPDCTDAGSSGEGWTAVEIGLGAALIGISINTTVRNSPHDVVEKWKLEIVDQATLQSNK